MGLLDGFSEFVKTPEGQGLLATVAGGMAGARRGAPWNTAGIAGISGLRGYQNAIENTAQAEYRQMQTDAIKRAQEKQRRQEAAIQQAAPELRQAYEMGVPISDIYKRMNPEAKFETIYDKDGREVKAWVTPNGATPIGSAKASPLHFVDTGGKVIAVDPITGLPRQGASFGKTLTPDGAASNAIARERLNFDKTNAVKPTFHDGSFVYPPTPDNPQGTSVKIPGMEKAGNPSEGERKAATLLQRLEGSQKQLAAVTSQNPDAQKPEIVGTVLGATLGNAAGNTFTSADRQRVEAAQLDMLDAALTLGTGAAYTKEQLEGYRKSLFPQIGDDDATVKDKAARLQNVIESAKVAAGRAAASVKLPADAPQPDTSTNDIQAAAAAELARRKGK